MYNFEHYLTRRFISNSSYYLRKDELQFYPFLNQKFLKAILDENPIEIRESVQEQLPCPLTVILGQLLLYSDMIHKVIDKLQHMIRDVDQGNISVADLVYDFFSFVINTFENPDNPIFASFIDYNWLCASFRPERSTDEFSELAENIEYFSSFAGHKRFIDEITSNLTDTELIAYSKELIYANGHELGENNNIQQYLYHIADVFLINYETSPDEMTTDDFIISAQSAISILNSILDNKLSLKYKNIDHVTFIKKMRPILRKDYSFISEIVSINGFLDSGLSERSKAIFLVDLKAEYIIRFWKSLKERSEEIYDKYIFFKHFNGSVELSNYIRKHNFPHINKNAANFYKKINNSDLVSWSDLAAYLWLAENDINMELLLYQCMDEINSEVIVNRRHIFPYYLELADQRIIVLEEYSGAKLGYDNPYAKKSTYRNLEYQFWDAETRCFVKRKVQFHREPITGECYETYEPRAIYVPYIPHLPYLL